MTGVTPEQIADIKARAERLTFLVLLGEAAAKGRIIEAELKAAEDFIDIGHLIGTAIPALIAEVERLRDGIGHHSARLLHLGLEDEDRDDVVAVVRDLTRLRGGNPTRGAVARTEAP